MCRSLFQNPVGFRKAKRDDVHSRLPFCTQLLACKSIRSRSSRIFRSNILIRAQAWLLTIIPCMTTSTLTMSLSTGLPIPVSPVISWQALSYKLNSYSQDRCLRKFPRPCAGTGKGRPLGRGPQRRELLPFGLRQSGFG